MIEAKGKSKRGRQEEGESWLARPPPPKLYPLPPPPDRIERIMSWVAAAKYRTSRCDETERARVHVCGIIFGLICARLLGTN